MTATRTKRTARVTLWVAACLLALAVPTVPCEASGSNLDGRMAPDMTFPDGANGVAPGQSLSDYRGQKVVWVKFVLRDCPHCRRTLPRAQQLHERWGGSGLVVLVVVHKYGAAEITPFIRQFGYTFPVGSDPTGSLANRYGVRDRPTDYLVGIDGRVRASNGASDEAILNALAEYRVARVGALPASLAAVRTAVWNWKLGEALQLVEAAAAAPDADAGVREAAARVEALAAEELAARLEMAVGLERRRQIAEARNLHERIVEAFQGTSLEARASQALADFRVRHGG